MRGGEVSVAIINYGVGNLLSISTSLRRAGAEPKIIGDIKDAESFDAMVFPGVGAFKPAVRKLMEHGDRVLRLLAERPILGICLGMQLLYERSEEGCPPGEYLRGFGVFKGLVRRLPADVKVPQMGWNTIHILKPDCPLVAGIPDGIHVYYANSYASPPSEDTAATTNYGIEFTAIAQRENVFGTQFHPEKSGKWGLMILRNFVEYARGWRR
ncbi:MAG: imidazole glycerol phosphate synthase subunit HisH [Thaumarchaeota archaeon]|nr:MAG: imidazole glycerol phosphate synthase subunit HisH [Nitrososphaerota archaeon]